MNTMHVAVAIVAFRNTEDVVHCLSALAASTHTDFEVVVCENGGADAHQALCLALAAGLPGGQRLTIISGQDNPGYAGGVNLCIGSVPEADAWWVLNPDTEPRSDAMAALVGRLAMGDCDAVGGTLLFSDGRVHSYGGQWRRWLARGVAVGMGESATAIIDANAIEARQNYISGASMMIGRRFVEATGLMRDDYFIYCEEVEWCLRGISRGMRLGFTPSAVVAHAQGTTTGSAEIMWRRPRLPIYLNERNRLLLTRDCFPALLPLAVVAALALHTVRCAKRGAWRQFGHGLAGWWAGVRNERGRPVWI